MHPVTAPLVPCSEQSEQVNAALLLKDLPPTMREALKVRVGLARTRSGRMATTQVRVQPVQLHSMPFIQIRPLVLHPVKAGRPKSNHTAGHPQLKGADCSPQSLCYLPVAMTDAAVPSSICILKQECLLLCRAPPPLFLCWLRARPAVSTGASSALSQTAKLLRTARCHSRLVSQSPFWRATQTGALPQGDTAECTADTASLLHANHIAAHPTNTEDTDLN